MTFATALRRCAGLFLAALLLVAIPAPRPARAAAPELVVFAAASTTNAINDIGALYAKKGLGRIKASFASSSTLAKQIEQGAPADVFLSANIEWMDHLEKKNLVEKGTRKDLLRNRIALIVPQGSKARNMELKPGASLLPLLGKDGRLAVGDPAHVPVGMYGKQALENLKMWDAVKGRIAPAKDVRAGLMLVERGEAPLGLVYESDAAASGKVRVIAVFPKGSHPEVIYPMGAIAGKQTAAAKAFITFLTTPEAKGIFKRYGFIAGD